MKALFNLLGYTGRSLSRAGDRFLTLRGESCNIDTHRGEPWSSRGYKIYRKVGDSHSKSCASWNHVHTDEGRTPIYLYDTALYPETGSDSPSSIASSLTATFRPVFAAAGQPNGQSVFFNGTNSEAQLIQEISSAISAKAFSFAAPTGATATPSTTGGSLADGDYSIMVTAVDDTGAVTVESYPQIIGTKTVSGGGGSGSIAVSIAAATLPTRSSKWRVYVADGVTTYSSHLLENTDVTATTSYTIQSLAGTTSIVNINETIRQAHLPLDSVDSAWVHMGRLFIGSSKSNKVYFSERDNINHWYTVNEINTGTETSFGGTVVGGISAYGSTYVFTTEGIHRVYGQFTRDDSGTNPTYILNMGQAPLNTSLRLVGPNAVAMVNGQVYFMSDQGLATITASGAELVQPGEMQGMLDRLDYSYRDRWVVAEDPQGYVCILVTRLTNSSRPLDGASVAGIADTILRFDYRNNGWAAPLRVGDITHISTRSNGAAGATGGNPELMAGSYTGRILQLGFGFSGGGPADVSGTLYDGQAATTSGTTSAVFTEAGVSNDQFNGMTVTLKYPDDDTVYPGLIATKTITDTAVSGSDVTVSWQGAITVPSASGAYTVRIAGLPRIHDIAFDASMLPNIPPGHQARIKGVRLIFQHIIGAESTS